MSIYEIIFEKSAVADFSKVGTARVTTFPWNGSYHPITTAQVVALEKAFAVRMSTDETNPRTEVRNCNGPVHTDSCMEFFFMPDPDHSKEYINWEFNSAGILFLSIGKDRYNRCMLEYEDYVHLFQVKSRVGQDGWEIGFQIPYAFLKKFYPFFRLHWNLNMKGNFYKCADLSDHPHYGCWSDIDLPQPDFHSPDFFGDLIMKQENYNV